MNENKSFEAIIGAIILLLCGLFFTHIFNTNKSHEKKKYSHNLYAKFNNIEGIKVGSKVKIGGVYVGVVEETKLKTDTYQVNVKIGLRDDIQLPTDSIISVASTGLLGEKFLNIKPGVEEDILQNGSSFNTAISTINLEDLIGKVVAAFGSNK